jgi:hypothetical protein
MSRGGGEVQAQGQTRAYVPVTIRVPKDSKTVTVGVKDKLVHDGTKYEIVSVPPIPNADDEVEFTCKATQ